MTNENPVKNEEHLITKFIAEAVILITAHHLGIEVEMLDMAQKVWKTKLLPEAPLLGRYAEAADKAREAINQQGLAEKADHLGHVFYLTGEFPAPCEIVQCRDYLLMFPLRSALGDCTAGGLTSHSNQFDVFAPHLSFAQVIDYCLRKQMNMNKVLKLVRREGLDYIHAEPVINRSRWYMAGGNFIYSSDSRFKKITGIQYPVSVHDRTEG